MGGTGGSPASDFGKQRRTTPVGRPASATQISAAAISATASHRPLMFSYGNIAGQTAHPTQLDQVENIGSVPAR
jgi:hypothetical protein